MQSFSLSQRRMPVRSGSSSKKIIYKNYRVGKKYMGREVNLMVEFRFYTAQARVRILHFLYLI